MATATDPQWVTIDDFTPGIIRFNRGNIASSPTHRILGSAFNTWRCYAVQNVGLCPFPTYSLGAPFSAPSTVAAGSWFTVASIANMGPTYNQGGTFNSPLTGPDQLMFVLTASNAGTPNYMAVNMVRGYAGPPFTSLNNLYSQSSSSAGSNMWVWPNVATGIFNGTGGQPPIVRCAYFVSPIEPAATSVIVAPDPASNAEVRQITTPSGANANTTMYVAYTTSRAVFLYSTADISSVTFGYSIFAGPGYFPTDINAFTTATTNQNYVFPELGSQLGAWGSVSTGEFFVVYAQQGGAIINGDIAFPSSATKLAGVVGTGLACGPAIESPLGLLYCTDYDGVYAWNGGNTSQKMSMQVPDAQFVRANPIYNGNGLPVFRGQGSGYPGPVNVHNDVWGNWAMFANNWVLDCVTGNWWQCENPAVRSFEVHTQASSPRFFYSAPQTVVQPSPTTTNPLTIGIYSWDRSLGSASYMWQSNPLATAGPGFLYRLDEVELTVTNGNAPATIVVTPVPSGDPSASSSTIVGGTFGTGGNLTGDIYVTPPNFAVMFNVPANVTNYRMRQRMGWLDSQVSIRVDVANTTSGPPPAVSAPVIHTISASLTESRRPGA